MTASSLTKTVLPVRIIIKRLSTSSLKWGYKTSEGIDSSRFDNEAQAWAWTHGTESKSNFATGFRTSWW